MEPNPASRDEAQVVSLVVRRRIRASAARLFAAWTRPEQVERWWGPPSVTCIGADIDLRVGGRYRIAHRMPDGAVIYISGVFRRIEPPRRLVYTWQREPGSGVEEEVTVRFEPMDGATEVVVVHERITDPQTRETHQAGWNGCLNGLDAFVRDEADRAASPIEEKGRNRTS